MNIETKYAVSGRRASVSSCGPYVERALSVIRGFDAANENADYLRSIGYTDVEVSVIEDCASCGHSKRDHFESKGTCDLGFCSKGCHEYVAPE